jgi:bla regulator protein blaR1
MMLVWMIYVIAVTLLLACGALAGERAERIRHSSTRWIWALAITLSLLMPTVIASVSIQLPSILSPAASQRVIELRNATSARLAPQTLISGSGRSPGALRGLDPILKSAWMAVSVAMLLGLMASAVHLHLRKRGWSAGTLLGTAVFFAPDVGPAVVGLLRPRIVVPCWLLSSATSQQEAVMAHERSHIDAGDARLFTAALFLLVFMPWNLPLWWQLRRLRYAIEVDCDRRVLKSGCDAVGYGEALIAVGERNSTYIGAVAAMSESKSFLEQRITIMMSKPGKWQRATAATLFCISTALVAVATQVSPPNATSTDSSTHQEIAVDTSVLDHYVGSYKLSESAVLTVTRHDSQLIAQLTGQAAFPIFPQSTTEFFYKVVDAQISFLNDANGQTNSLLLHQNGRNMPMVRIDTAVAQQIAVNLSAKIQSQIPTPGSEAALRRLIAGIGAGKPNYDEMTLELADVTRQQLSKLQGAVLGFGAVQSVEFRGVGNQGWDIYDVKQEHGAMQWRIALASDGKIAGALVSAGP